MLSIFLAIMLGIAAAGAAITFISYCLFGLFRRPIIVPMPAPSRPSASNEQGIRERIDSARPISREEQIARRRAGNIHNVFPVIPVRRASDPEILASRSLIRPGN